MRICEGIWIYYKASWCNGRIVYLELVRPWFVCRLQCPFSLRSGRGSVSLSGLFLLGRIITEVIAVNPVALLGGTSFPTCLPTGIMKDTWLLVLFLALPHFRTRPLVPLSCKILWCFELKNKNKKQCLISYAPLNILLNYTRSQTCSVNMNWDVQIHRFCDFHCSFPHKM